MFSDVFLEDRCFHSTACAWEKTLFVFVHTAVAIGGAGKELCRKSTPITTPFGFNASTISQSGRFVLLRTVAEMTRSVEQFSIKSCRRQLGFSAGCNSNSTRGWEAHCGLVVVQSGLM